MNDSMPMYLEPVKRIQILVIVVMVVGERTGRTLE